MIRKTILLLSTFALFTLHCFSAHPKLIVVISLDQFRYDYIPRFREHFGKNGFNYLLNNGANFTNASYKHGTNTTGPGHAAMLSGTYANMNGIIANDWFDRDSQEGMYCAKDKSVRIVGANGEGRSPRNFIGSTLGDELRLKSGFNSKVISVSNKDRAAIFMGGKNPTGVFWMMDSVFVTSTYYMSELPDWVKEFNNSRLIDSFFGKVWKKKLPESAYAMMDVDDAPYEKESEGMGRTFPHTIVGLHHKIDGSYYAALLKSPFAAEVLAELAKQAIEAEKLGQRGITDMLCVSFSSTDIVGHSYGPHSHEVMDMALRMDDILADFFSGINKKVGLKNCVFVLTADHGVAPIPEFIQQHNKNTDAGRISSSKILTTCSAILNKKFGEPHQGMKWLKSIMANNIYLDRATIEAMNFPTLEWAARELADSLKALPEIATAYTARELSQPSSTTPIEYKMKRSFHKLRSGDVVYALKPYWMEGDKPEGTTHGEPYDYDAHVPVIICGDGIRAGTYAAEASPIDIAPTLSALLGIEFPAGRDGRVLAGALNLLHH